MKIRKIFFKALNNSFGFTIVKKFFTIFSGLIFLILMTRYLGPELRGKYAYIINSINIYATIFNFGISLVLPNYIKRRDDLDQNVFFSFSVYQYFLYTVLSVIIYLINQNLELFTIFLVSALTIFRMQVSNISLIMKIKLHSYAIIVSSIINFTLIIIVYISLPVSIYYVVFIYILKEITIIYIVVYRIKFKFFHFKKSWLRIIKSGIVPMLTTGLIALNYRIDVLLLDWFSVPLFQIGLFATGVALAEYSWLIPDIFKEVMLNKNTKKDNTQLLNLSLRFAFTAVFTFAIFFLVFGNLIIKIMFGEIYLDSYPIAAIMFLAVPFMVFVKIISTLFITNGKWNLYFYILTITASINILLNIFMIPKFGVYGSAIASIASYAFCGVASLIWYSKNYNFSILKLFFISKSDSKLILNYLKS